MTRLWSATEGREVEPGDVLDADELADYHQQLAYDHRYNRRRVATYSRNEDTAEHMYEQSIYGDGE